MYLERKAKICFIIDRTVKQTVRGEGKLNKRLDAEIRQVEIELIMKTGLTELSVLFCP